MSDDEKYILEKATHIVYRGPTSINNIEVIECGSWKDFQDKVKFMRIPFGDRVFRGQGNSNWGLKSKWDRYREQKEKVGASQVAIKGRNDTPESFLKAFQDNYIGNTNFDTSSLNPEQWMARGAIMV